MKFKVGDIVRGLTDLEYGITNTNMTKGEVIAVGKFIHKHDIVIKVLEHKNSNHIGEVHSVNSNFFELIEPQVLHKIVINTDGKTTLARMYDGKKVMKSAEAKCSPQDKFDFDTGAKLAFERLMEPAFEPHLKNISTGTNWGKIGTPTKMKDILGRPLFVGDVIRLFNADHDDLGTRFVSDYGKHQFIMGIYPDCDQDGTISKNWIVIKEKDFHDLKNGEIHDYIKAVLEE